VAQCGGTDQAAWAPRGSIGAAVKQAGGTRATPEVRWPAAKASPLWSQNVNSEAAQRNEVRPSERTAAMDTGPSWRLAPRAAETGRRIIATGGAAEAGGAAGDNLSLGSGHRNSAPSSAGRMSTASSIGSRRHVSTASSAVEPSAVSVRGNFASGNSSCSTFGSNRANSGRRPLGHHLPPQRTMSLSQSSTTAQSSAGGSPYSWDFNRCPPEGGRIGLRNLGNTCFMNTGLQCLCHLEPLVAYFLSNQFEEELMVNNPKGTGGRLARTFASLVQSLWNANDKRAYNPSEIHSALKSVAPSLLSSYQQQDVQEFLVYMMDCLHEDLNLATNDRRPHKAQEEQADAGSPPVPQHLGESTHADGTDLDPDEEYAAACAWKQHLSHDKSCMVDLFQGQLRSCLTCMECNFRSSHFDPFLYMSVPLPRTAKNLGDAIAAFLEGETLSGQEQWHCERCKKKVDAKKKIDIWKVPPVLVLHLKRFEHALSRFSKIDVPIKVELSGLDFGPYVSSKQRQSPVYDVWCVAHHIGSFGFGHYTASCRDPRDGSWHVFNDETVEPVKDADIMTQNAYVLFLVRRPPNGAAAGSSGLPDSSRHAAPRQTISDARTWPHFYVPQAGPAQADRT